MADSLQVGARFQFSANFEAIARVAAAMERLAEATKGIQAAADVAGRSVNAFGGVAARAASEASDGFVTLRRNIDAVGAAADRSGAKVRRFGAAASGGIGSGFERGAVAGGAAGAFGRFAAGAGTVAGIGALATMYEGTRGAANLQDASIQTAIALGRSNQFVARDLVPLAMRMSMSTAQSVTSSMEILRTMATSGLNDPAQLRALAMPIARFADTQFLGKNHVAFEQSAAMASGLAHQLNLRTAAQLSPFLNSLFKLGNDMPDSLRTAATQIKYFGPSYVAAGVDPSVILQLQATADRLGYGSAKSGTGLNMLLRNLQSPSSKRMWQSQGALGLLDADGNSRFINQRTGVIDPDTFFGYLNRRADAARRAGTVGAFRSTFADAFSSNSGLIAAAFSSDAGIAQRENVRRTMSRVENMPTAQLRLMGSLNNQTKLLATNFQTLATVIAGPLLTPLTSAVHNLADVTGRLAIFFQQHPTAQRLASGAVTVGSVLAVGKVAEFVGFGKMLEPLSRFAQSGAMRAFAGFGSGIAPVMRELGEGFNALGPKLFLTRGGLEALVPVLGRLGLRAIPVAGELMLAVDAIKAFVTHGADINFALGKAARWMDDVGKPMLVNAITGAWAAAIDALKRAIPAMGGFVVDSFRNSFIGGGVGAHSGIQGMAANALAWIHDQQVKNDAAYRAGYGLTPVVVHGGTYHFHGVQDPHGFAKALSGSATAAMAGGAPVSPHHAPALTIGLGFGTR